jgi:hypothetical protein
MAITADNVVDLIRRVEGFNKAEGDDLWVVMEGIGDSGKSRSVEEFAEHMTFRISLVKEGWGARCGWSGAQALS